MRQSNTAAASVAAATPHRMSCKASLDRSCSIKSAHTSTADSRHGSTFRSEQTVQRVQAAHHHQSLRLHKKQKTKKKEEKTSKTKRRSFLSMHVRVAHPATIRTGYTQFHTPHIPYITINITFRSRSYSDKRVFEPTSVPDSCPSWTTRARASASAIPRFRPCPAIGCTCGQGGYGHACVRYWIKIVFKKEI